MPEFTQRSQMPCSVDELFDWHMRPGAFARLSPPWDRVEVERWAAPDQLGRQAILRVRLAPFVWKRWIAEYREYVPGRMFRDVQISGPFAAFDHRHLMTPASAESAWLEDRIDYAAPLGAFGQWVAGRWLRRSLENLFAYRHRTTADDLAALHVAGGPPLRVLLSGSTGLVGSSLVPFLTAGGHTVERLVRREGKFDEPVVPWASVDDASSSSNPLDRFDAVVHLAGEGIAARRWTDAQKNRIRDSRIDGTNRLCRALARLATPPQVLVCASAVGIYGDRGEESLTEDSVPGEDFLAHVCRDWEAATQPARDAGIRVVSLRFGVILSARGGALQRMLPPFRMGVGGRLGSGRQYMSWVAIDDVVGAIHHALVAKRLAGPVNVVAPHPATNAEFTRTLGRVLRRPAIFPLPAFAARLAFGELADALLLASQRVVPQRLTASGYRFRYSDLETALRFQLGRIAGRREENEKCVSNA